MPRSTPSTSSPTRGWFTWLKLDIRAGEHGLLWRLFALHFCLLSFQYVAKTVRQASYVDSLGAAQLPWVYLLAALCSYPLLRLYNRYLDRFGHRQLLVASSLGVAAGLVFFWWALGLGGWWPSLLFYLWIAIVGLLLVSQLWCWAGLLLDPRQARRLFGVIGAGGILGGIAGGQAARWISAWLDTRTTLLVGIAWLVVAAAIALTLRRPEANREPLPAEPSHDDLAEARGGFALLRHSPYLRLLAGLVLLATMVAQVIDLQLSWVIETSTTGLDQRTAAFGNLYSLTGLAALLCQLLLTGLMHRRHGVRLALYVLPVSNGLGTLFLIGAALAAPALVLPAIWWLKISENGLRYSLDQSTRELLFLPLPESGRGRAKAFIDVFVQRFGKGAAAIVLLSVTFGWLSVQATAIFSLLWIAAWLVLLRPLRKRYIGLFRQGLPEVTQTEPADLDLTDSATLEVLVEGLGSCETRRVLHSLDLLAAHGRGQLVTPLMLHHPDPEVRQRTLQVLRDAERSDALPQIERLLGDGDPGVRATATRVLADLAAEDARALMRERLRDSDVRVRAAALAYLASQPDPLSRQLADKAISEMLGDGDAGVRRAAAGALGSVDDPRVQAGLVQLLYDSEPAVVLAAIEAISGRVERGARNPLFVPILVSHLHQRQLKHSARAALVAYGPGILPALEHFLTDPSEEIWVRRALPKTVAQIGGAAAADTLCRAFSANDPFLRRKLIEALGSLSKGELGHPIELFEQQLEIEARSYLRRLLDLESIASITSAPLPLAGPLVVWPRHPGHSGPHLLEQLLADRMNHHLDNLFGLLALLGNPDDIQAAHQGLVCGQPGLRAHALEYLDNTLRGEARQRVLAVIDDLPRGERHRRAMREFGLRSEPLRQTLERLIWQRPAGDADAAWWSAAALHFILDRQQEAQFDLVHRAAKDEPDPMVRETTELLLQRLKLL